MILRHVLRNQLLQCCYQRVQHVQQRNIVGWIMYSAKKGVDRDFLTFLQQPIDPSQEGFLRWANRKKWEALKENHRFVKEQLLAYGPDLSTAHFIVQRGGAVKFVNSNRWIEADKDGQYRLPDRKSDVFSLEAVDASNTEIMYMSFDSFVDLRSLRYLNLSNCKNIDDWCVDRLQAFKRTLVCLDVSGNCGITERGLAALHKLNLRYLRAHNMAHVPKPGLTKLMLEEMMPLCSVEGLEGTMEMETAPEFPELPQLQQTAGGK